MEPDDAIERIYQALIARELDDADLSARRIASFLGKTTGAIYHRWGSLDGLLFAVSQRGFVDLAARVQKVWARTGSLSECAAAYVDFGLDHPGLYPLMFERRFDWSALRAAGSFERATPGGGLLAGIVCVLEELGSIRAVADTRLLMAGLHGLVAFAASGRMNAGELTASDREIALVSARDLATRLVPTTAPARAKSLPKRKRARP